MSLSASEARLPVSLGSRCLTAVKDLMSVTLPSPQPAPLRLSSGAYSAQPSGLPPLRSCIRRILPTHSINTPEKLTTAPLPPTLSTHRLVSTPNPTSYQRGLQRLGLAPPGPPTRRDATPLKLIGLRARTHAQRLVPSPGLRSATIGAARRHHPLIGQFTNPQ